MRKDQKQVRKKIFKIRMNEAELNQLKKFQQHTTERNMSHYVRKVALQKPVLVKYRNQSVDDFLREMLELKKELNAIGNNYNQAVKKLHLLDKIPEFRSWILNNEVRKQAFMNKVEEIKLQVNQLYKQWLQK